MENYNAITADISVTNIISRSYGGLLRERVYSNSEVEEQSSFPAE